MSAPCILVYALPTPAEVDELAREWNALQTKIARAALKLSTAKQPEDAARDKMVDLVRDFGSTHAEKSKRLYGVDYFLMVTESTSHSTDAAAVERFRLALIEAGQSNLLSRIFKKDERWVPAPGWETIVKSEKLSDELVALFAKCDVPHDNAPRLKVELRDEKKPAKKKPRSAR